jgi:predicted transcriptional regulator
MQPTPTTVLLSIKPEHASRIFAGDKRYEFRRAIFKHKVKRVVVYASAPISMVIGEFEVEEVLHDQLDNLWKTTSQEAGITRQFFDAYFLDKTSGYAIRIKEAKLYDSPLPLRETYGVTPPQFFLYL